MILLCGVSALGSYSRGALVAVSAMAGVLWWKSRHKLLLTLVVIVAIPVGLSLMPEKWYRHV